MRMWLREALRDTYIRQDGMRLKLVSAESRGVVVNSNDSELEELRRVSRPRRSVRQRFVSLGTGNLTVDDPSALKE